MPDRVWLCTCSIVIYFSFSIVSATCRDVIVISFRNLAALWICVQTPRSHVYIPFMYIFNGLLHFIYYGSYKNYSLS